MRAESAQGYPLFRRRDRCRSSNDARVKSLPPSLSPKPRATSSRSRPRRRRRPNRRLPPKPRAAEVAQCLRRCRRCPRAEVPSGASGRSSRSIRSQAQPRSRSPLSRAPAAVASTPSSRSRTTRAPATARSGMDFTSPSHRSRARPTRAFPGTTTPRSPTSSSCRAPRISCPSSTSIPRTAATGHAKPSPTR